MDPDMYPQQAEPYSDPEAERRRSLKRVVLVIVVLLVVIIGFIIFNAVSHHITASKKGTLVITTNSPQNIISATNTANESQSTTLKSGVAALLDPGSYAILVKGPKGAISQTANLSAGQTEKFNIDLTSNMTPLEPVADVNAQDFVVGNTYLDYVDLDKLGDSLDRIDSHNRLSQLNTSVTFTRLHWADATFGVGQDNAGRLYAVNNGNVTPIATPAHSSGTSPFYDIAPDHTIYLVYGTKVYRGSASGNFQPFYLAKVPVTPKAAANGRVALVYNPGNRSSSKVKAASITVVDANGKPTEKNIEAYDAAWSPGGKYIITTTDASTQIYTNSLELVANVPINNVNNMVWVDDHTILFSVNDQLWEYTFTTSSGKAQLLTQAEHNHAITNIVLDPTKAYAYVSVEATSGNNDDLQIWRYGLRGQQPQKYLSTLQNNLPSLQGRCLLSLVNFTAPAAIQSYGGHPEDDCGNAAQIFVAQQGIDPGNLKYLNSNLPPDESPSGL